MEVKKLRRDPDALVLYALALLYLFLPNDLHHRIVERMSDPAFLTLAGLAGGGRLAIRAGIARSGKHKQLTDGGAN